MQQHQPLHWAPTAYALPTAQSSQWAPRHGYASDGSISLEEGKGYNRRHRAHATPVVSAIPRVALHSGSMPHVSVQPATRSSAEADAATALSIQGVAMPRDRRTAAGTAPFTWTAAQRRAMQDMADTAPSQGPRQPGLANIQPPASARQSRRVVNYAALQRLERLTSSLATTTATH